MSRQSSQSLQASKSLAQLLALNALFDAARAGDAARESAVAIQAAAQAVANDDLSAAGCDALLNRCYAALMDASERPPRLS